jgi:ribose-phosphate pyrophosphokinase
MHIIGGSTSINISRDLSKILKIPIVKTINKRFPDDELYIRILDDISGEDIIIVQNTYPDKNIIELLLIQDAVKDAGARTITVIIPYFGYSRQDKQFEKGEPISAKTIAQIISLKANKIITVDPHKEHILNFFTVPSYSCSAIVDLANYLKDKNVDFLLAPDKGALKQIKAAAKIIDCDFDYMEKTRIDGNTIKIKPKNLDVSNKNIAIIDDIISTGGTMAKSIHELKKQGGKKIFVLCTHGLFARDAVDKLISAGCDDIISSDTIYSKFSKVKCAPSISKMIS